MALWRLLTDATLRAEVRAKGLRRAAAFSWQRAAEQTMDVYRKAAGLWPESRAESDLATRTAR